MPGNLCPICQSPIPKNAKACPLHRAQSVLENKDTRIILQSRTIRESKARKQRAIQVDKARRGVYLQSLRIKSDTRTTKDQ